jgi:hypothetical protein
MTPSQAKKLRVLSALFKEGKASPQDIKELSELLALINSYDENMSDNKNHHDTNITKITSVFM